MRTKAEQPMNPREILCNIGVWASDDYMCESLKHSHKLLDDVEAVLGKVANAEVKFGTDHKAKIDLDTNDVVGVIRLLAALKERDFTL